MKNRLREARERAGLDQEEVAQGIGVARTTIIRWESGKGEPQMSQVKKLANLYGVSILDLTGPAEFDEKHLIASDTLDPSTIKAMGETVSLPLLDDIISACAGTGNGYCDVTAYAVDMVDLPKNLVGPLSIDEQDHPFLIKVEGDSMRDAGILEGQYAVINPMADIRSGDPALVIYDDQWAIKWVYWQNGGAEFRSANLLYPPRNATDEELRTGKARIVGKVMLAYHKPKRGQ